MSLIQNLLDPLVNYRHEPGDPPLRVRMDITNKCNLLCKMCHYPATVGQPKFDMEPELVQKIVDQIFPHAEWVGLACQYEASMSRHFEEVLDIVGRGPCKQIGLVSNATLWSERRIDLMLSNPNLTYLAVSIDGGTKETYERIRVNGKWDKLMRNLDAFATMRDERGEKGTALVFNTVLMKSTALELVKLVDLAGKLGAVRVEAIRFLDINPELKHENITDWEEVMPTLVEAKKLAHDYGMQLFLPIEDPRLDIERDDAQEAECNTNEIGKYSKHCEAPWSALQIHPQGDLHPCSVYGKVFGNLRERDFIDIWNDRPYLELRRSLAKMKLHPQCAACNPHGYDKAERKARFNETGKKTIETVAG